MQYKGKLYRALNPVYARTPLSGEGAALYGGRFNPKGIPALYTSLSMMTTLREINRVGNLQPTTLVSYDAEIDNVFDCRDEAGLAGYGMDSGTLADPTWRDQMQARGEARTQSFARRLIDEGYQGLIVRSFTPGAESADLNVVLWKWGSEPPSVLVLIDDENRLRR